MAAIIMNTPASLSHTRIVGKTDSHVIVCQTNWSYEDILDGSRMKRTTSKIEILVQHRTSDIPTTMQGRWNGCKHYEYPSISFSYKDSRKYWWLFVVINSQTLANAFIRIEISSTHCLSLHKLDIKFSRLSFNVKYILKDGRLYSYNHHHRNNLLV